MRQGLIEKRGLTTEDISEIRELAESCNKYDGFEVKLNWGMLSIRKSDAVNDFCYYDQGQLVGYLPLDSFGNEYEITGLVLPAYRRQAIFRQLFTYALPQAINRQATRLLLVAYKAFSAAPLVAQAFGGEYNFSEYRMEAEATDLAAAVKPSGELKLIEVTIKDLSELRRLLALSFDDKGWGSEEELRRDIEAVGSRYLFARLGAENIGQIGMLAEGPGIYIRGVGIVPTYRGKGYGRQLLAGTVQMLLSEGQRHFELDVVTQNQQALTLYTSCGFKELNVYDYYTLPLPT